MFGVIHFMNKRLHELDSLRGLAALSVMVSHFALTFSLPLWCTKFLDTPPFYILIAGHQAVIFFFILSGFVLSLPFLDKNGAVPYSLYLIKRVLRIYPPYILAACSALLLREVLYTGDVPGVSEWFNNAWRNAVTLRVVIDHFMMIGPFSNNDFNPVLWSLVQEMRISLFFPLLIWLVRCKEKLSVGLMVSTTGICFLAYLVRSKGLELKTISFITPFVIGALLAKYRHALVASFSRLQKPEKWLMVAGAVFLYTNGHWLPGFVSYLSPKAAVLAGKMATNDIVVAAAVSIFIISSLASGKMSTLLTLRPVRFLGQISYSLYLYHAVCLKAIVIAMGSHVPLYVSAVIAAAVTFLVATLSYRFVEIPSIQLGKWISKRFYEVSAAPKPENLLAEGK